MKPEQARTILGMLESFRKIDRPACDEVDWVALKLSCTRAQAAKKIEQAKTIKENAE